MQHKVIKAPDTTAAAGTNLPALAGPQKAAIIIQMVLSEGGSLPLASLSPRGQTRLMQDFVELGRVDRATLAAVVSDLERDLAMQGISFPRSVTDALGLLESHLSPELVNDLRGQLGLKAPVSPWAKIAALEPDALMTLLPDEDPKVAAIVLSKLDPEKASELLDRLDPAQATKLSLAMQDTSDVTPDMLLQIGQMLTAGLPQETPKAFSDAPALRVANLLNAASPDRRDEVLASLGEQDPDFAAQVRKLIFTFADIATRITAVDIAKITRDVSQEELVQALAYAKASEPASTSFILDNISKRMADALQEEMAEIGEVPKNAGEAAMGAITSAIRALSDAGELTILPPNSEGEAGGET
jgi:flagellar motor switch protein FliG